jgi:phosphopantothenoylcysteine decarboxylase/phosphopantothenate--cysteine ligase
MDGDMWTHPATQANLGRLRDDFGYAIVEPDSGALASGQTGVGRLAELPAIVDGVVAAIGDRPIRAADPSARPPRTEPVREPDLEDRHVVISAGGTREPIDPVRFIGNRSTGKMGVAIAAAALDRGARVTLVAANLEVEPPAAATIVRVGSTSDLRTALHRLTHTEDGAAGFDALVMAAAVADFRPEHVEASKVKKEGGPPEVKLVPTPDILAELGADRRGRVLVGFAAETSGDLLATGRAKLEAKRLDLVVVNEVGREGTGFGAETDDAAIVAADGRDVPMRTWTKAELAAAICDRLEELLGE